MAPSRPKGPAGRPQPPAPTDGSKHWKKPEMGPTAQKTALAKGCSGFPVVALLLLLLLLLFACKLKYVNPIEHVFLKRSFVGTISACGFQRPFTPSHHQGCSNPNCAKGAIAISLQLGRSRNPCSSWRRTSAWPNKGRCQEHEQQRKPTVTGHDST